MSHQNENMAYVGAAPWHGLGNLLTPRQSIDVWARQAGMSFRILEACPIYRQGTGARPPA